MDTRIHGAAATAAATIAVFLAVATGRAEAQAQQRPTFQPTQYIPYQLSRILYVQNFVTGSLALACSALVLLLFFALGGIRKVGFFRHARVTRPFARVFMTAYERMNYMVRMRTPSAPVYRARRNQSASRALFFVFSAMFVYAVAAAVLFVYLTIGIFFQAMLIYRTFPLPNTDPLSSPSYLLAFIKLWWDMVIRYIVPPLYTNTVKYDTTAIYQPMVQAFSWLVNLKIDFASYINGLACPGSFVAPLELLLNVAIVFILLVLVEIDYSVLFGPVMNGTYDKHLEVCFFSRWVFLPAPHRHTRCTSLPFLHHHRPPTTTTNTNRRGCCGRLREVLSVAICVIYRIIDVPQQFNNAMHFLSTLITYRTFFAGSDMTVVGTQAYWRHQSSVVCDNIVFYTAGASKISNVDTGLAIVCTLGFYALIGFAVGFGSHAVYPSHDRRMATVIKDGAAEGDPEGARGRALFQVRSKPPL